MQPPTAHIVAPSALPAWVPWLAAALMYASALALVAWRRRRRGVLLTAGGLGVAGTVAALALAPTVPAAPGYAIRLALPAVRPLTTPLRLTVCGRLPDGSRVDVPGPGTLLTVLLDGRQVMETGRSPLAVDAAPGAHELRVEVITTGHREFRPPLDARLGVVVDRAGPLPAVAPCPRR